MRLSNLLWIKYLKINCHSKDMQITTKLRDKKDHFMVTIYKEERKKINISVGDILILNVGKDEFIRQVRKNFWISLPKRLLKNKNNNDKINLSIRKLAKIKDCEKRTKNIVYGNKLDIRYFIPRKTRLNYPLYIIERNKDHSSVWYPVGGGARHLNIKNFVNTNKIAELIGFYFGDGSTSKNIQSFRLTNCEPSVLNYCLDALEEIGIERDQCKIQVIYSTNKELTDDIKNRCIDFWSRILNINRKRIVSVTKAKNIRETLEHGSARIFIGSTVLVEILLHGLLKCFLQRITNPQEDVDYQLLRGFMRGLLAAEGCVYLNKQGSLIRVSISYNPHSEELNFYKTLLKNLGIGYGMIKGNELYIPRYKNMKKLFQLNAFKMHELRNQKFIKGFKNHKFFKTNK